MEPARSDGILHCPLCFCMREFVLTEEANTMEPYPAIECSTCGYEFHTSTDEEKGTSRPTVSPEVREAARERFRNERMAHLVRHGYRLESLQRKGD